MRASGLVLLSMPIACRAATPSIEPSAAASEPTTAVAAGADETADAADSRGHVDTLEELCEIMLAEFEDDPFGCSQDMCSCKPGSIEAVPGDGVWREAALLDLRSGNDHLWVVELAIAEAGGWRRLGVVVDEESAWTSLDGGVGLRVAELEPSSPGAELRLDVFIRRIRLTGDDDEAGELSDGSERFVIVCGSADGGWCVTLPIELRAEGQSAPFAATVDFDGAGAVRIGTSDPRWAGTKRLRELQPIDHFPWFQL